MSSFQDPKHQSEHTYGKNDWHSKQIQFISGPSSMTAITETTKQVPFKTPNGKY